VANKIYIPSYISFETVLQDEGMVFQGYTSIFVASYKTKDVIINGQKYCFRTIRDITLTNHRGVYQKDGVWIASAERAFLDTLYLNKDYYFDNLSVLD
jgi:predicted transcriptional regulator of viral defense system